MQVWLQAFNPSTEPAWSKLAGYRGWHGQDLGSARDPASVKWRRTEEETKHHLRPPHTCEPTHMLTHMHTYMYTIHKNPVQIMLFLGMKHYCSALFCMYLPSPMKTINIVLAIKGKVILNLMG